VPVPNPVRLSDLTTLRLGGPAPDLVTVTTADEIAEVVGSADRAGSGVLVLGGGSNLVVADRGIDTPVVRIGVRGIRVAPGDDGWAEVTVGAGENWDDVVAELTGQGFAEFAPLSGIPGSAGATPIQNVGAYGTEIAEVLTGVTVYERASGLVRRVPAGELGLGYRHSVLRGTDRAVVSEIAVRLHRGDVTVRYAELARTLDVSIGAAVPPADVRAAVLDLRRKKGMVLDPDDPDTYSVGSFFTNPIVEKDRALDVDEAIKARLGPAISYPAYPVTGPGGRADPAGRVKLSAAWLIERAGYTKGFQGRGGRVSLSTKHTLALTNRGGSTADLIGLARQIRDGVRDAFTISLQPEPTLIGVSLDD
jgi:UDP-N-acetylmuramate dehydrogenase